MSTHLREHYGESISPNQLGVILDLCDRQVDVSDNKKGSCLICEEELTLLELQGHLAAHMEDIALFALPNSDEDKEIRGSSTSMQLAKFKSTGKTNDAESEPSSFRFSAAGSQGQTPLEIAKILSSEELGYALQFSSRRSTDEDQKLASTIRTQKPREEDGRARSESLPGLKDISRIDPYTATPQVFESFIDRSQSILFGPSGNPLKEPVQRFSQQRIDAPPFHETNVLLSVVTDRSIATGNTIKPEIQADFDRGFFQSDGVWTCYRRNYFSVSCSFSLHPWTDGPLFLSLSDQPTGQQIRAFSMSISAIVNSQFTETRELVQYIPRRDNQSEKKPGIIVLQPCKPSPLVLGHGSASNSDQYGSTSASQSVRMSMEYDSAYSNSQHPSHPPMRHTFERIQFQKATANNGKRRAQQQYYNLVVELYADIAGSGDEPQWESIARRLSHPLVVRGRSPGYYKDGRRDSTTSMAPDGGSGTSEDGSGGVLLPLSIGRAATSSPGSNEIGQPAWAPMGEVEPRKTAAGEFSCL
jgi:hypothetical protein